MINSSRSASWTARLAVFLLALVVVLAGCGASDPEASVPPSEAADDADTADVSEASDADDATDSGDEPDDALDGDDDAGDDSDPGPDAGGDDASCEETAALFVTRGSANENLADPEVAATCEGDTIVITSNAIPDYTYIETSPGQPAAQDYTFTIPATPTVADEATAVPLLGTAAVSLGGIPIFGPTEGTGGDVESLPGILSDCGSHNGPTGFHIHLILTSADTDCLFTPEEVAAESQLVGYAFDGFPIYTGIDQYTSSWELTDETLFATDTWAAHTYVEGSGDLDECNGRTDEDGNYAYYTTATFPYVLGCYTGVVDLDAAGGGGGGGAGGGDRPDAAAEGEQRPARPDAAADDEERPARPEDEDRPERPEPPADGDAPPEQDTGA